MKEKELFSPLMEKYRQSLKQNPKSRAFAPLAEIYRKHTMHEQALEILKKGIRYNPEYALGYLGLAECYYDKKKYSLVYSTLRPLVGSHRENLRMQKLFAKSCEQLKYLEEALDTYKHILLLSPKDEDTNKNIQALEKKFSYVEINHQDDSLQKNSLFDIKNLSGTPGIPLNNEVDDWEEVNTHKDHPPSLPVLESKEGQGLMDAYDKTFSTSPKPFKISNIEKTLWGFHTALKKRAKQKHSKKQ